MVSTTSLNPPSFLRLFSSSDASAGAYSKYMPSTPSPAILTEPELYSIYFEKKDDITKYNCLTLDHTDGIIKMTDKDTIEKTRGAAGEIFKKLGKSIFSTNAIGFSLPAIMFEPRSELDRLAEVWRLEGYYLNKASKTLDPIERIKLVTIADVAPYYLRLRKKKSFNPLLGETFQCTLADGTDVNLEQISHHPPIMAYYNVGPSKSYAHFGSEAMEGSFKGNYLLVKCKTTARLQFKNGQEIVWLSRPSLKICGILLGDRYILVKGQLALYDRKNNIKSVVFFDYGEKKGIFGSAKTVTKDKVEGIIYVPDERAPASDGQERRISDLKDIKTEIARISGSWFESISINDTIYWHIDKITPMKIVLPKNPLPSDSRYREDLMWLRKGDLTKADSWKDALEIRQREDQKLRTACKK